MEYVYKYVDHGDVVYVGITNDLLRRTQDHTRDKLASLRNVDIYYVPVNTRTDAELLETYLINFYHSDRYYNVAKSAKDVSVLDNLCCGIPWVKFDKKKTVKAKPFVFEQKVEEKIVEKEKTVYVDVNKDSVSAKIDWIWDWMTDLQIELDELIDFDEAIADGIRAYGIDKYDYFRMKGLALHTKRLCATRRLKRIGLFAPVWPQEKQGKADLRRRLIDIIARTKIQIEQYEEELRNLRSQRAEAQRAVEGASA